ncbi:MAG: helix-turn-helix domain-containing protein [Armatimonadota bacterium]
MRSLEDWLKYVDSQAEAARRKKLGETDGPAESEEQKPAPKSLVPPATGKALISFAQTAPEPERRVETPRASRTAPSVPDVTRYIPGIREIISHEKQAGGEVAQQSPKPDPQPSQAQTKPADTPQAEPSPGERSAVDTKGWHKLPRQLQLLLSSANDEVASRYYKPFRESREELIRRLLDPELSLEEAARLLGVCPTTVRRYTNKGYLPHYRTAGNQRRFRLSDILEFMERRGALSGLPLLDREDEPE